ncbi:MAG: membrane protein insertion efficiency factor YidD, partial [Alphaproteobacteria bacterium]
MRRVVAGVIRGYQLTLSVVLGRRCRFEPTCSEYTRQAVLRFGVVRGVGLGMKRVGRC